MSNKLGGTAKKEVQANPFDGIFAGSVNLIETKNGNTVVEMSIDINLLNDLLDEPDTLKEIESGSSYKDGEGKVYLKLKGIPLKEPKSWKTHFIVLDYYKKQ